MNPVFVGLIIYILICTHKIFHILVIYQKINISYIVNESNLYKQQLIKGLRFLYMYQIVYAHKYIHFNFEFK